MTRAMTFEHPRHTHFPNVVHFLDRMGATSITQPLDLIKNRMQMSGKS